MNIALFAFVAWGLTGEFMRSREMHAEVERLQARAVELESRNLEVARLARQFAASEAAEREARLKLGLKRPGEDVVIVRDEDLLPLEAAATAEAGSEETDGSVGLWDNFRSWWHLFFGG